MTRRDFQLIADALADCGHPSRYASPTQYRIAIVYTLADRLATTNPRFDYDRFTSACEPLEAPVK
jgi:hypothetical protein